MRFFIYNYSPVEQFAILPITPLFNLLSLSNALPYFDRLDYVSIMFLVNSNEFLNVGIIITILVLVVTFVFLLVDAGISYIEKVSAYVRNHFDVRFYFVAMLFIVFDLEVIFCFPWCASFSYLTSEKFFSTMNCNIELLIGYIYAWIVVALESSPFLYIKEVCHSAYSIVSNLDLNLDIFTTTEDCLEAETKPGVEIEVEAKPKPEGEAKPKPETEAKPKPEAGAGLDKEPTEKPKNFWQGIKDFWQGIKDLVKEAIDKFKYFWRDLTGTIKELAKEAIEKLNDFWQGMPDIVKDLAKESTEKLKYFWQFLINIIKVWLVIWLVNIIIAWVVIITIWVLIGLWFFGFI